MIAYGTCSTAAATAVKVVTITDPTWNLKVGNIVGVFFSTSNTASTVKLNVNGSGEIQVALGSTRPYTGKTNRYTGYASKVIWYYYDGAYWCWMSDGSDANDNTNTIPSAYCSTAATTAAKTASCTDYALLNKSYLHVLIKTSNTVASALTLNVNSKGAKAIYINDEPSSTTNYTLPAGTYLVYYENDIYYFRTDGAIPGIKLITPNEIDELFNS